MLCSVEIIQKSMEKEKREKALKRTADDAVLTKNYLYITCGFFR